MAWAGFKPAQTTNRPNNDPPNTDPYNVLTQIPSSVAKTAIALLARRPALGTPEGIKQVTLGHEHQRPGRLLRVEVGRGETGLHVARDAARHRHRRGVRSGRTCKPARPWHRSPPHQRSPATQARTRRRSGNPPATLRPELLSPRPPSPPESQRQSSAKSRPPTPSSKRVTRS